MDQQSVSLIHGVRRLHRLTPNRAWMRRFHEFLASKNVASVTSFEWSGGLIRGFLALDATAYADSLATDYRNAQGRNSKLSIVAKSLGGLIAEHALARLRDEIEIDTFLRIGVPDRRVDPCLANVSRVINVTSDRDALHWLGKWITPLFVQKRSPERRTTVESVRVRSLSHYELTELRPLDTTTTYDLYWRLLSHSTAG